MTSANRWHCPKCGREGSEYVCTDKYWRYVCPKHHTWQITVDILQTDTTPEKEHNAITHAFDLLDRWEQSSAASEATDLADETLKLLQIWGIR